MSLIYDGTKIPFAKELRRRATKQENHLWHDYLKYHDVRFQRQKVIGNYIVDFYCSKAKLAIELDGAQHYSEEGLLYDAGRSQTLSKYGIHVLRFSNREVDSQFENVCWKINEVVENSIFMREV